MDPDQVSRNPACLLPVYLLEEYLLPQLKVILITVKNILHKISARQRKQLQTIVTFGDWLPVQC
jgi:hypothetical protein